MAAKAHGRKVFVSLIKRVSAHTVHSQGGSHVGVPSAGAVVQLCWSWMRLLQRNQTISVPVVQDFTVPLSWDPLLFLHMVLSVFSLPFQLFRKHLLWWCSWALAHHFWALCPLCPPGKSTLGWVQHPAWGQRGWFDPSCGAGAGALQPLLAWPFLGTGSQGRDHPFLCVGSLLPREPSHCCSHPHESSSGSQANC